MSPWIPQQFIVDTQISLDLWYTTKISKWGKYIMIN